MDHEYRLLPQMTFSQHVLKRVGRSGYDLSPGLENLGASTSLHSPHIPGFHFETGGLTKFKEPSNIIGNGFTRVAAMKGSVVQFSHRSYTSSLEGE